MARPTSRACPSVCAPTIWISSRLVAPSPSSTIASASVRATSVVASSNTFQVAPSRDGSMPAWPFARKRAVSLVLVSPSTEIALNVWSTTRFQNGRSVPGSETASVVITASNVAISGWIMPAPLAMPPMMIGPPGVSRRTAQCFGRVSVVMIARAASTPPAGESFVAASRRPRATFSTGSGTPMTPVESTRAVRGGRPAASSALRAIARAASSPAAPVHAFATRAFIATARVRPGRSASISAS